MNSMLCNFCVWALKRHRSKNTFWMSFFFCFAELWPPFCADCSKKPEIDKSRDEFLKLNKFKSLNWGHLKSSSENSKSTNFCRKLTVFFCFFFYGKFNAATASQFFSLVPLSSLLQIAETASSFLLQPAGPSWHLRLPVFFINNNYWLHNEEK